MKRQRGFTIVEIITVVLVISILASIAIIGWNVVQRQARDSERKSDTILIKTAIEKYYEANGTYPLPAGCTVNAGCSTNLLSTVLVPTYIASIPTPPTGGGYAYVRGTDAEANYAILVTMEAMTTCKMGAKVNTGWWGSSVPICDF